MRKTIIITLCFMFSSTFLGNIALAKTTKAKTEMPKAATNNTKKQPAKTKKQQKAEKEEWKRRKQALSPLQMKDLVEENHKLRSQKSHLNVDIEKIKSQLRATIQEELKHEKANAAIRDLSELPKGSYTIDKAKSQVFIGGVLDERYGVDSQTGIPFIKGVIFKVQIGANKNLDLHNVLIDEVNHENLEQEKENDLYKYTLGHFRNYWEADKLKKGLRSMGVRLAWIVPYKDGKRVLLKEVLNVVIAQEKSKKTHPAHATASTNSHHKK